MEQQELISVIIPVYNVEKYLCECIDSVLNQSYENLEIILVDDGSTDGSGMICDEYGKKDARIKVIHQKNQGLSGARNTGFQKASGEYIYFLDSDDWIVTCTIEKLLNKAKDEEAEVVFFEAYSFEDGHPEQMTSKGYSYENAYATDKGLNIIEQLQKNKEYHSAVPLLFINRNYMEKADVRFEPGILYEDMLFTYELFCKANRVTQLKDALYRRRYRNNSIMTSKKTKKNFECALIVYEKIRDVSRQLEISHSEASKQYIVRCAFNVFNYYKALDRDEQKVSRKLLEKFRQNVLENKSYGNKALQMRCYGYVPWIIYKVFEKAFVTGMRGKR